MGAPNEIDDLAARIAALPDDAQQALARRVLRRFGSLSPADDRQLQAEMLTERLAVLAWEKANGTSPGQYRAAG